MEQEPPKLKEKYIKLEQIATGTYGVVYKGKNKTTNELCAIKKFKNMAHEGIPVSAIREINALKNLNSEYIIPILDVFMKKDSIKIVMPWKNMTLGSLINSQLIFKAKYVLHQLLRAIESMHSRHYAHRDLKPTNIMIDQSADINLKIIDLGMAREMPAQLKKKPKKLTIEVGTLYYRAPELLLGNAYYDTKIDIWSIGCIFYELITKKILFKGKNEVSQLSTIYEMIGSQEDLLQLLKFGIKTEGIVLNNWGTIESKIKISGYGEQEIGMLKQMLCLDPSNRLSASQLLSSPYFTQISS